MLRHELRRTICAGLREALGLEDQPTESATKGLLVSCAQLGLDALARVPASVGIEHTGGSVAGLAPDFDLNAYTSRGPVVAPSAWPDRAAESCITMARIPRLVLRGDGLGFFRGSNSSSGDGNFGGARQLMTRLQQRWGLADSTSPVFETTGTDWGDWSLTLVRTGAVAKIGGESGTRTSAFPSSTRWSLRLTERGTSRMPGPIQIARSISDARGLQALTGDGSSGGASTVSVAASWVRVDGADRLDGAENIRDSSTDARSASQLFELVSWEDYDRRTLEPLAAGHAPRGTNKRLCIQDAGAPARSHSPCAPVALLPTADSSSVASPDRSENRRIASSYSTYPAMSVQMRRSITQGEQTGFHRTLTTVLESPVAFLVPTAHESRREGHKVSSSSQPNSQHTVASPGHACVLALVETLGEDSFIDPYEVEDLLAYQGSQPTQQPPQAHRLGGMVLFDMVDLEKPADSAFTSQVTLVSWTTVTLPASSSSSKADSTDSSEVESREPWVRFDMPIHMRYLPPLQYNAATTNRSSSRDGYTEVSIPPPMVAINCGSVRGKAEAEAETHRDGALEMSGWTPVTVIYRDGVHSTSDHPKVKHGRDDGVVSAEIPTGQLAHAALVWYGTLAATLFAALGVVTKQQT